MRATTDTPRTDPRTALTDAVSRCGRPRRTLAGLLVAATAPLVALAALRAPGMVAAALAGAIGVALLTGGGRGDTARAVGHPGQDPCWTPED